MCGWDAHQKLPVGTEGAVGRKRMGLHVQDGANGGGKRGKVPQLRWQEGTRRATGMRGVGVGQGKGTGESTLESTEAHIANTSAWQSQACACVRVYVLQEVEGGREPARTGGANTLSTP
jgi:hypothetical protein